MIWILLTLVILDAMSDAFYDNGRKYLSGIFDMLLLGLMIFAIVLIKGDWRYIIVYVTLRYALFDLIYNIMRNLHPFHVGSTKPTDKLLSVFGKKWDEKHVAFISKLMSLVAAIGLTIRILYW